MVLVSRVVSTGNRLHQLLLCWHQAMQSSILSTRLREIESIVKEPIQVACSSVFVAFVLVAAVGRVAEPTGHHCPLCTSAGYHDGSMCIAPGSQAQ